MVSRIGSCPVRHYKGLFGSLISLGMTAIFRHFPRGITAEFRFITAETPRNFGFITAEIAIVPFRGTAEFGI